jgi:hypothetical protein
MYFVVPLWFAAGIGDWICHRRSRIELNSGLKESVMHFIMLLQIGLMMLPALFFEINGAVIALAMAAFVVHEATALADVTYATSCRKVTPAEQSMHSMLEMIPLMAIALAVTLHWDQFIALFGYGTPDFSLTLKAHPLSAYYLTAVMVATVLCAFLPYIEELVRCWRARTAAGYVEIGNGSKNLRSWMVHRASRG